MKPYLKYGLHMTLALFLISFIGDFTSLGALAMLLYFGILTAGIYLAIRDTRHNEGGHISFGRGFGIGMAASAVTAGILAVLQYIRFKFLQPDYLAEAKKSFLEQAETKAKNKEELDAFVSVADSIFSAGALSVMMFLFLMFLCLIISLIVAAAMKNEDPHGGMDFPPRP